MVTTIRKWGNSLALRIPNAFAREVGLEQGAPVEVSLRRGKVVIEPIQEPPLTLAQLLEGITDGNLHGEVHTGPPVGKETW
ncbi:MAG: AbrB/MazE/SpoVT family DNA-binding domain-containing protein [Planctomycetes bacterium]|nr:AbrB/MazE/SpoVT family DNA-binding domain-containing protein [Planctomycetota bacterium]